MSTDITVKTIDNLRMATTRQTSPAINWYTKQLIEKWFREHPDQNNVSLSKKIGISKAQVGEIRNHGANIGIKTAIGVASLFGMSYDELQVKAAEQYASYRAGKSTEVAVLDSSIPSTALGAQEGWHELKKATFDRYKERLDTEIMHVIERASFGMQPEQMQPEDIKRLHDFFVELFARDPEAKKAAFSPV